MFIKENLLNELKKDTINNNTENSIIPTLIESDFDKDKNKIKTISKNSENREEKNELENINQNNYLYKIKENQSINFSMVN